MPSTRRAEVRKPRCLSLKNHPRPRSRLPRAKVRMIQWGLTKVPHCKQTQVSSGTEDMIQASGHSRVWRKVPHGWYTWVPSPAGCPGRRGVQWGGLTPAQPSARGIRRAYWYLDVASFARPCYLRRHDCQLEATPDSHERGHGALLVSGGSSVSGACSWDAVAHWCSGDVWGGVRDACSQLHWPLHCPGGFLTQW